MDGIPDIDGGPWLDNDGDSCGDIGTNTQVIKILQTLRFACVDNNLDGSVDVSVCTSWDNNAGTVCNDLSGVFPGTNSKCSCDAVELGIPPQVPVPGIVVSKDPATQAVAAHVPLLLDHAHVEDDLVLGDLLEQRAEGIPLGVRVVEER